MTLSALNEIYEKRNAALQQAERRVQSILGEVVARIEDKTLVRAEVRSVRVKTLSSLERKAAANGWKAEEAFSACSDLIGGRVVCNNIEDVYRFAELLKDQLPSAWGEFEIQDHIKNPNSGGYRALHVNFRLDVGRHPLQPELLPCEVQIRSRLQDFGPNCLTTIFTSSQTFPRISAVGPRIWPKCWPPPTGSRATSGRA